MKDLNRNRMYLFTAYANPLREELLDAACSDCYFMCLGNQSLTLSVKKC